MIASVTLLAARTIHQKYDQRKHAYRTRNSLKDLEDKTDQRYAKDIPALDLILSYRIVRSIVSVSLGDNLVIGYADDTMDNQLIRALIYNDIIDLVVILLGNKHEVVGLERRFH